MKFAQILRSRRKALGLTQKDIGATLGISHVNISDWENGRGMPEASRLPALAKRLEMTVSELMGDRLFLTLTAKPVTTDLSNVIDELEDAPIIVGPQRLIPIVGRVEAGPDGLLHIDDFNRDSPDGYLLWFTTCTEAYALRIRGESMSPRYLPGEFVGVDPCAEVLPSDEVIVLLKDGRRMIKRLLWQRDDQACFESVNKAFQNIVLETSEIVALHLVLGRIPRSAFRQSLGQ